MLAFLSLQPLSTSLALPKPIYLWACHISPLRQLSPHLDVLE